MEGVFMGRKVTFAVLSAFIVIILLASFFFWRSRSSSSQQTVSVGQTVTVEKGTVKPSLRVTGVIAAKQQSLSAPVSSKVVEIYVQEGETVTAGQKLLKLDDTAANQDVNVAATNLRSARQRLQDLKDKAAASADILAQEAVVARAQADYNKAVENWNSLTLTAPFNGTVIDISVNAGDQVGSSGTTVGSQSATVNSSSTSKQSSGLITVADLSQYYLEAAVDQADISKVAVGQKAKITLDALPDKDFSGQVTALDPIPTTNQNVVTYTVKVSLEKQDSAMRLGMTADIEIDLGQKENVLIIPNGAVHTNQEQKVVTKLVDGQPTEVPIETGAEDEQFTEVTSGLEVGDKIVLTSFTPSSGSAGASSGGSGSSFRFMSPMPFGGGSRQMAR
jgi:RND family efflux transporter MFP subunit